MQSTHGGYHGDTCPLPGHRIENASKGSGLLGTARRERREQGSEVERAVPSVLRAWGREREVLRGPRLAGLKQEVTQQNRLCYRNPLQLGGRSRGAWLGSTGLFPFTTLNFSKF